MAYVPTDDDEIVIANIDQGLFAEETLSTEPFQKMKEAAHQINYFICGYKAILAIDEEVRSLVKGKPKGMKIMIDSLVPPAAGLSSSSAYTVCAAVTTMHANGIIGQISKQKLADLTIRSERNAGTACGGMDQTISIMAEQGCAKLIDFIPDITATTVKIPESVCLVIANSLTPSPKLLTLGTRYNKRVVECRFALAAMALRAGKAPSFDECSLKTFQ
mmetsp:Transcript_11333/g.19092  ORF Transcript_11333/g.19092 Transcript_11333/m.19092 type:complete len:218 (+) Transcript_11333:244-897(+)